MIGPAGGSINLGSEATLTVPAGALASMTMIGVARTTDNVASPWMRIDSVYRLMPVGTPFSSPVSFTWHNVSNTAGLYWWTTASRQFATVTPTISGNDVTITNTHFSCVLHTNSLVDPSGAPSSDGICREAP
jgi:hypothetical protein